ncbi:heterokaryon incompatibility protein-domain-containing protein [Xylaria scruposa]|nr:heterokaryon incompatibility protein-domain-containing protein [Xylaria scruposa]
MDLETVINLFVHLLKSRQISNLTQASFDYFWATYLEEIRGQLSDDQYENVCVLLGSPLMTIELLDLSSVKSDTPNSPATRTSPIYSPISQGEIRLIVLLPSSTASAPVECVLGDEILERSSPYEALSYVWGDPSKTKVIKVNGQDFAATENLEAALRSLRYPQAGKFRVLWIDAICIDQNNVIERNEQVQHMDRIYSSAQHVCVWLGKENNTDKLAIELLYQFPLLHQHDESVDVNSAVEALQNPTLLRKWDALSKFFARPWWSRVWVLQEVLLAKKATMYCGKLAVDWGLVGEFCTIAALNSAKLAYIVTTNPTVQKAWDSLQCAFKIESIRRLDDRYDSSRRFLKLLEHGVFMSATDPRDHVYGIMGLLQGDKPVVPDYRSVVFHVCLEA